jgi:hypothetical protein
VDVGYLLADLRSGPNLITKIDKVLSISCCDYLSILCTQESAKSKEVRPVRFGWEVRSGALRVPRGWKKVNARIEGNVREYEDLHEPDVISLWMRGHERVEGWRDSSPVFRTMPPR